jgi:hypothetical protein
MTTTASQQEAGVQPSRQARAVAGRRAWILALISFLPLVVYRAGILSEADTFWQIRIGLLTMAHHAIPATDSFSWTMHGTPYFQNSWGFDVLLAVGYRLGGLPGVAGVCALITVGIAALALQLSRKLGASATASAAALFLAAAPLAGWLSARPQLVDYAAVLGLAMLLRRIEQGRGRWGAVALIGLLTVIWINLHAAGLLAVALTGATAVLLAVTRRGTSWRYAAAATVAAVAGCLANPYGIGVLHQAGQVQSDSAGLIVEWVPVDLANPLQDAALAAGLAALVIAWRRREVVLTAGLAISVVGAAVANRMLPFGVLFAAPVLAAFASDPPDPIRRYLASRRVMFVRCGALAIAALVALATPSLAHIGRPEPSTFPLRLVADIPHECRLFNSYQIGGYVILARPDVLVSLDSRNNLYGRTVLLAEERLLDGHGDLTRGLAGAGCVLVPSGYGLALRLRHDPQWELRAADRTAVLYVRSSSPGA